MPLIGNWSSQDLEPNFLVLLGKFGQRCSNTSQRVNLKALERLDWQKLVISQN